MFVTSKILDLIVKTKDDAHALAISALIDAHRIALGCKEVEITALKNSIAQLTQQLSYERSRADGLVDRLLVRDAQVAAVSPAAIEIAKHKDEEAVKKLSEIFDQLNEVAAEPPTNKVEPRAFDLAGGSVVARS